MFRSLVARRPMSVFAMRTSRFYDPRAVGPRFSMFFPNLRATMAAKPTLKSGELRFVAFHPSEKPFTVRVIPQKLHQWASLGEWRLRELEVSVSEVLDHPAAIFEGLRKEDDDHKGSDGAGWWCYAGIPSTRFINYGGGARKPADNEVLLVFVTDRNVAYNVRWEKVEFNQEWLRGNHPERFQRRIYLNPQLQGHSS